MAATVADYLLERLREWDVEHVFAYPGDGINGILAAWGRAGNQPKFIQARHEEMAAFEAVGYAKFTGRVGVCMATSGPGRDPPAQRPLRRQAGPRAGRRDRRPDERAAPWAAPTSRRSTCSACSRTSPATTCRWSPCPSSCPNVLDRAIRVAAGRARADRDHHPRRRPGAGVLARRRTPSRWCRPRLGIRLAADLARRRRDPAGRRDAQRGPEGRDPGRPGRPRAPGASWRRSPSCSAPASRSRCWARTCCSDELPYVTGSIGLLGHPAELRDDDATATRC